MKTDQDLRLECARLAVTMCIAKAIGAADVVDRAKAIYGWVLGEGDSALDQTFAASADLRRRLAAGYPNRSDPARNGGVVGSRPGRNNRWATVCGPHKSAQPPEQHGNIAIRAGLGHLPRRPW